MTTQSIYPQQLLNAITNGFNLKTQDFSPGMVADYDTSTPLNSESWGSDNNIEIQYPEQYLELPNPSSTKYQSESSIYLSSISDYSEQFSLALKLSGSYLGFSASDSADYIYHQHISSDSSKSNFINVLQFRTFSATRTANLVVNNQPIANGYTLNADFLTALQKLPTDSLSLVSNLEKYSNFFDQYGTHLLTKIGIGGYYGLTTCVEDSVFEKETSTAISNKLTAGFNEAVSSDSVTVDTVMKNSSFNSSEQKSITMNLVVNGGQSGSKITDWENSLYSNNCTVLFDIPGLGNSGTELQDIGTIVATYASANGDTALQTIAKNIQRYLPAYIAGIDYVPTILPGFSLQPDSSGSYVQNVPQNQSFLVAAVSATADNQKSHLDAYTNNKFRTGASEQYKRADHAYVYHNSLSLPLSAQNSASEVGETFSIDLHTEEGAPETSVTINQFNQAISTLQYDAISGLKNGEKTRLKLKNTAGFIMGRVDWNNEDPATSHLCIIDKTGTTIAGASQYYDSDRHIYVPKNSFCIPYTNQDELYAQLTVGQQSPTAAIYVLPAPSNMAFSDRKKVSTNTQLQADNDMFLTVFIYAPDGACGHADLYCYRDDDKNPTPIGRASVQNHSSSNHAVLAHATATIAVPRGFNYEVRISNSVKNENITVDAYKVFATYSA